MKTIGLIGGMSWESSALYYAMINREVRDRLGALHSARILLHSLEFGEIERLQHAGEWEILGEILADSARSLEGGGADMIVLCTNTMHKLAPSIEDATSLPLLHIADPTAAAINARGFERVGLLATAFTMEEDFYRGRLESEHGLEVIVPEQADRTEVHRVIYEELCAGIVKDSSRDAYRDIIARLIESGAQCVILGCTEITMLVDQQDSAVPLFDTTSLHTLAAVDAALA